jgi:superfamily II DNA or RNA helicase
VRFAPADEVRATIAARMLGRSTELAQLGNVTLHAHQRDGLARVRRLLDHHGGALLADDVGLGKTYVALGVAREFGHPVVVVPSAIREQWSAAASRADAAVRFVSTDRLSRPAPLLPRADLVVIDEAHHFRNPGTRRFRAASELCREAKVLLLSATPVQNRLADLQALLSLFLGQRAFALAEPELARFVVRRAARDAPLPVDLRLPRVLPPRWLDAVEDTDCLDRLIALPPAVPPVGGADGGALLTYTLARQWASSRAALVAALYRRLARGAAMLDALRAGRHPSRAELAAWAFNDGAQQLAFPELVADHAAPAALAPLLEHAERHIDGLRELVAWLRVSPDPDAARVATLRSLADRHAGERIVAFSEYVETVAAFYRGLRSHARVAMLSHGGGRVVGGEIARGELLARFAPGGSSTVAPSDRIDLLLTTDVLSEGVDLHDASVVVHLDLAWNPARLEQRVGRLRRLGAPRDEVAVYMFAPPAPAERILALERRLRDKTRVAASAIGSAGGVLPGHAAAPGDSAAGADQRIAALLGRWRSARASDDVVAGAARSDRDVALACVSVNGASRLVAILEDRVTDAPPVVEDVVRRAMGADVDAPPVRLGTAVDRLERWLRRRIVVGLVDLPALRLGRARREVLRRVESIASRLPRHSRAESGPLIHAARAAASVTLSAGAETVLAELALAPVSDQAWLRAVGEFAALHARGDKRDDGILALLLLCAS